MARGNSDQRQARERRHSTALRQYTFVAPSEVDLDQMRRTIASRGSGMLRIAEARDRVCFENTLREISDGIEPGW